MPKGKSDKLIPRPDRLGDKLQNTAKSVAKEWDPKLHLTRSERKAIRQAYSVGEHWRAKLLEAQARGRWVEAQVRELFPEVNFMRKGVDVPGNPVGYDIMSGTKSNMEKHAKRMDNVFFRYITF